EYVGAEAEEGVPVARSPKCRPRRVCDGCWHVSSPRKIALNTARRVAGAGARGKSHASRVKPFAPARLARVSTAARVEACSASHRADHFLTSKPGRACYVGAGPSAVMADREVDTQ